MMDRFDLQVRVPPVEVRKLQSQERKQLEDSSVVAKRIAAAREMQLKRFAPCHDGEGLITNSDMKTADIEQHCVLESETLKLLREAAQKFALSARGYYRVLKVSRTIADLAGEMQVRLPHVAEALQYRMDETI